MVFRARRDGYAVLPRAVFFLFLKTRSRSVSTLFPYTTLFRSVGALGGGADRGGRAGGAGKVAGGALERSEEHTSELQSLTNLVCRLRLEKRKKHKMDFRECSDCDADLTQAGC